MESNRNLDLFQSNSSGKKFLITDQPIEANIINKDNDNNLSFFQLNFDVLLYILHHLNPINLYYLSLTNKFLLKTARHHQLWKYHSLIHFPDDINPSFSLIDSPYLFYTSTSRKYYSHFKNQEMIYFTLIRANDSVSIIEKQMDFNEKILELRDMRDFSLLSLIRKNKNISLNNYVFTKIYEKEYRKTELIHWGIKLDQNCELFQHLLNDDVNNIRINSYSLLHIAVSHNSIRCIELLLKLGADPNLIINAGYSPLYLAAQKGYLEIVELLVNNSLPADIDSLCDDKFSSLYIASQLGHIEIVKFLVQHGADINSTKKTQNSGPLYIAMQEGHAEIALYLLENGANSHTKYMNLFSPLFVSCRNNHLAAAKILLEFCKKNNIPIDINELNDDSTALYVAAQNGHAEMCRFLLQAYHADIESKFMSGYTPLYIAAQHGHTEVVKVLSEFNPNYNYITGNGSTALYVAAQNGHTDTVAFLCGQENCDTEIIYLHGYTPLYVACQKGHLSIVKTLVMAGVNVNPVTTRNATPLYVSAQKGFSSIVTFLVEHGADPNICFENGYTPLHMACCENDFLSCVPIISCLVKAGTNLLTTSLKGEKISEVAQDIRTKQIMHCLEKIAEYGIEDMRALEKNALPTTEDFINVIENFISNQNKIDKLRSLANNFISFLSDTFTSFGRAVILCALLNNDEKIYSKFFDKEHINKLIQCIVNTLGFQSRWHAKKAMYAIIKDCLPHDDSHQVFLLNKLIKHIINPISNSFLHHQDITLDTNPLLKLSLTLFETNAERASQLIINHQRKII